VSIRSRFEGQGIKACEKNKLNKVAPHCPKFQAVSHTLGSVRADDKGRQPTG